MSTKYEFNRKQILTILVFCFILIGLNLFLLKQNSNLKQTINANQKSILTIGETILPLKGKDFSDNHVEIGVVEKHKTLLFIFSATCYFCDQNASNWRRLAERIKSKKIRMIGISISEDGEVFIRKHKMENQFLTINFTTDMLAKKSLFDATPQTILLDTQGKVEKIWRGILDEKSFEQVLDSMIAVDSIG